MMLSSKQDVLMLHGMKLRLGSINRNKMPQFTIKVVFSVKTLPVLKLNVLIEGSLFHSKKIDNDYKSLHVTGLFFLCFIAIVEKCYCHDSSLEKKIILLFYTY